MLTMMTQAKKLKNKGHTIIITIFIVIILGLIGLYVYQLIQSYKESQTLNTLKTKINQQGALIKTNQMTAVYLLKKVKSYPDFWAITEIESILRMADLTLNAQHNIPTTILLLNIAQTEMQKLANPRFEKVHQLLSKNIQRLKAQRMADPTSLFLQLQHLKDQVDSLPFATDFVKHAQESKKEAQKTKKASFSWKHIFSSTWKTISKFLVIQKHPYPVKPILSEQEKTSLKLNLHSYLTLAQIALLQRHQMIYLVSLQKANNLILQYYLQSNKKVKNVLATLTMLVQIDITPPLPKIDHTLWALENIVHSYQTQNQKKSSMKGAQ